MRSDLSQNVAVPTLLALAVLLWELKLHTCCPRIMERHWSQSSFIGRDSPECVCVCVLPLRCVKVLLCRRGFWLGSSVRGNHLKQVQKVLLEGKVTEQHQALGVYADFNPEIWMRPHPNPNPTHINYF